MTGVTKASRQPQWKEKLKQHQVYICCCSNNLLLYYPYNYVEFAYIYVDIKLNLLRVNSTNVYIYFHSFKNFVLKFYCN